eukprot:GGOE01037278.1.p1 GENE.GGOE01037278.1~~GGOE01037278.1.p1  ORF type:complete len:314 (+),score=51.06 GGOE01037278.1:42-983(+)
MPLALTFAVLAWLQCWPRPVHSLPWDAQLLTAFHVNPVAYGVVPVNQNTADLDGFIAFQLMAIWQPLACLEDPTDPNCDNPEIFAPPGQLAVTQLLLEVDPHFGPYGKCNICRRSHDPVDTNRTCVDGQYTCNCDPFQAARSGGVGVSTTECSLLVGRHTLRNRDLGQCNASMSAADCWWVNMAWKLGGSWFTTTAQGLCTANAGPWCTWSLREVVHRVSKACADTIIHSAVEQTHPHCFRSCGVRNTTSPCWIRCFMAATLGPESDRSDSVGGLPLPLLRDIWRRPFRDLWAGGCPRLPFSGPQPVSLGASR